MLQLFLSGQTELLSKQSEQVEKDKSGREVAVNKYKLLVLANAACLELLVWAALDEQGPTAPSAFSLPFHPLLAFLLKSSRYFFRRRQHLQSDSGENGSATWTQTRVGAYASSASRHRSKPVVAACRASEFLCCAEGFRH